MPKLEFDKKLFVLVTKCPGFKTVDITVDPGFKAELDAYSAGKLPEKHPADSLINHSPYNFHLNSQHLDHSGNVKPDQIVGELTVPAKNEDGTDNEEGVILLEREEQVVQMLKALYSMGITNAYLDTRFGKDISQASKDMLAGKKPQGETDNIMTPAKTKKGV